MSVSFSYLLLFVSLFLALMRCLAVAIEMLRLNVCWNHIEGVGCKLSPDGINAMQQLCVQIHLLWKGLMV
jgi:hypothetical protein